MSVLIEIICSFSILLNVCMRKKSLFINNLVLIIKKLFRAYIYQYFVFIIEVFPI